MLMHSNVATRGRDRGQTVLLAPIALIIVTILGAVTLEVAAMHLRQRQLNDLADSLANDAATVGFDVEHYRLTGEITVDAVRASSVLDDGIAISNVPTAKSLPVTVAGGPDPTVTVRLTFEYEFVIGKGLFGASTDLSATGDAALVTSS